jgi:hypothetical protein
MLDMKGPVWQQSATAHRLAFLVAWDSGLTPFHVEPLFGVFSVAGAAGMPMRTVLPSW